MLNWTVLDEVSRMVRRRERRAVHKRQLIAAVAQRTSLTQAQVREALEGTLEVIAEAMATGQCVSLVGFGRFEANEHRPRAVRGLDGNTYHVDSRLVPSFHPYPSLRKQVQEGAAEQSASKESRGEAQCPEPSTSTPND
jgi:DNA-binding protein HU-beta